jgi:hypothetical protein
MTIFVFEVPAKEERDHKVRSKKKDDSPAEVLVEGNKGLERFFRRYTENWKENELTRGGNKAKREEVSNSERDMM